MNEMVSNNDSVVQLKASFKNTFIEVVEEVKLDIARKQEEARKKAEEAKKKLEEAKQRIDEKRRAQPPEITKEDHEFLKKVKSSYPEAY